MNVLTIAARNVARQKRRAMLLGGAVAVSVFVMLLVESLTNGMAASLEKNVKAANLGDIYVEGTEWQDNGTAASRLADGETLRSAIADARVPVRLFLPMTEAEATLVFGARSMRLPLVGIPWNGASSVLGAPRLGSGSLSGMASATGIVLPQSSADRLGILVGESLIVRATTVTGQVNVLEFTVAATLADSAASMSTNAYARIERVNELVNIGTGESQKLNLYVEQGVALEPAAQAILRELGARGAPTKERIAASTGLPGSGAAMASAESSGGPLGMAFSIGVERLEPWSGTRYGVTTLDDAASLLTAPIQSFRLIGFTVFAALLVICMVGILNTFRMVILERTREIGTIRAIGTPARTVRRLFRAEAIIMTGAGVAVGIAASLCLMPLVSAITVPNPGLIASFLTEGHLVMKPSLIGTLLCAILVIGSAIVAVSAPARRAASLQPAAALRSI